MKSIAVKFLAVLLAALFLAGAAGSVLGMVFLLGQDLYEKSPQQAHREYREVVSSWVAQNYAMEYAAKQAGMREDEFHMLIYKGIPDYFAEQVISVEAAVPHDAQAREDIIEFTHTVTPIYPIVVPQGVGAPRPDYLYFEGLRVHINNQIQHFTLYYYDDVTLDVTVKMYNSADPLLGLAEGVYALRDWLPLIIAGCLLLFAACMVYLCWAAGKKTGSDVIRPGGLNRLPLDLYAAGVAFVVFFGCLVIIEGMEWAFFRDLVWIGLVLAAIGGTGLCCLCVCFVFACAAQGKVKGFWWRHSVLGWCAIRIFRAIRWCWRGVRATVRLLPMTWQWLLTAAGMALSVLICLIGCMTGYYPRDHFFAIGLFFVLLGCVGVVIYGGYCFGTILKGAREMAHGNLNHKIHTKYLLGGFRDCGENLNALSQAAMVAAREQMKSERMKTELITNVSHDIKTPLTSIINYVDLLQQPHTQPEQAQYLEVLSRQSLRLKKLIDDLMEMSKASTGNVTVEAREMDATEAVLQALGEFGDKLEAVPLSIVFPQPETPVMIRADGRLAWRVMSNVLQNAVKYALPGTRLYVDMAKLEDLVMISFKNISRESLNISADELMERFVRGDASRNTEGSGLGLNIARSLMEIQGGSLNLLVDGDLFKVTLFFPAA